MKKWLFFILYSIPWFLFMFQNNYLTIKVPVKITNQVFYIFTVIDILVTTYSVVKIHEEYSFHETKEYNRYLIVFFVFFQGIFFSLSINVFLSFSCAIITLLSSLFLYYESKSYDKNVSKYLWYSLYYNLIICVLLLITYFMNL